MSFVDECTKYNNIVWLPIGDWKRSPIYRELNTSRDESLEDIKIVARYGFSRKKLLEGRIKRQRLKNNKMILKWLKK